MFYVGVYDFFIFFKKLKLLYEILYLIYREMYYNLLNLYCIIFKFNI